MKPVFLPLLAWLAPALLFAGCEGCGPGPGDGGLPDGGAEGPLFLNEYLAANAGAHVDEHGDADDWVELYNASDEAISLEGYALSDDADEPRRFELPAGAEIGPKGFLVVFTDGEPAEGPLHAPFRLSRAGEEILLSDPEGRLLDHLVFGPQEVDVSEGRLPDGAAEVARLFPTPGAPNRAGPPDAGPDDAGARDAGSDDAGPEDAGATDASVAEHVVVNEVLARPIAPLADRAGSPTLAPWVELKNTGDAPADVSGHFLSGDANDLDQWRIPEAEGFGIIPPGGYLLVFADDRPDLGVDHGSFVLAPGPGSVLLSSPAGEVLDRHDYGPQAEGISEGRSPDGSGAFLALEAPTPRGANAAPAHSDAGAVIDGGAGDAASSDGG